MEEQIELNRLLNIGKEELLKSFSKWRFNVLHVRGVESLTSEDVYEYFDRQPHSVEWLSNISCNVTFEDIDDAYGMLFSKAKALIVHKCDLTCDLNIESKLITLPIQSSESLKIPIPPNYRYILGPKHEKARSIIIRFATVNDRKASDFKETDKDDDRMEVETTTSKYPSPIKKLNVPPPAITGSNIPLRRVKRTTSGLQSTTVGGNFRMRMRADDEEDRINYLRQQMNTKSQIISNPRDLRSRLSNRQPQTQLRLGGSGIHSRIALNKKPMAISIKPNISNIRNTSSSRIIKAKRSNNVWNIRRTIDDRRAIAALPSSTNKTKDLRERLNEPLIRVQVSYDEDILTAET